MLDYVAAFLRAAHLADLRYTVRDGINIARYAMKVLTRGEAENANVAVDRALVLALGADEAEPFRLPD